jgi:hypothetical protein
VQRRAATALTAELQPADLRPSVQPTEFAMSPETPFESMVLAEMLVYGLLPVALVVGVVIASSRSARHPVALSLLGAVPVLAAVVVFERVELASLAVCAAGYLALCLATLGVTPRHRPAPPRTARS